MRPRLITAENERIGADPPMARGELRVSPQRLSQRVEASMRPRLITAENGAAAPLWTRPPCSFNEAAAHHRGELGVVVGVPVGVGLASMRPRLITAENTHQHHSTTSSRNCFNEAAAHHRGELLRTQRLVIGVSELQ